MRGEKGKFTNPFPLVQAKEALSSQIFSSIEEKGAELRKENLREPG